MVTDAKPNAAVRHLVDTVNLALVNLLAALLVTGIGRILVTFYPRVGADSSWVTRSAFIVYRNQWTSLLVLFCAEVAVFAVARSSERATWAVQIFVLIVLILVTGSGALPFLPAIVR